jgi:23S rRNA (guanine745-N1)-methyltransferase
MASPVQIRCPLCAAPLVREAKAYRCAAGHSFDLSREGYLSLLQGRGNYQESGDDKAMIVARANAHELAPYAKLAEALASLCATSTRILDLGCGEGFFLRRVLATRKDVSAAGLDISAPALAFAARRDTSSLYIRADAVNGPLPFGDAKFDVVLSVFAPHPKAEIRRVLAKNGRWIVVTASPEHITEARAFLPLAGIGEDKSTALAVDGWTLDAQTQVCVRQTLTREELAAVVEMSPSVFRLRRELGDAWADKLPASLEVTFAFEILVLK